MRSLVISGESQCFYDCIILPTEDLLVGRNGIPLNVCVKFGYGVAWNMLMRRLHRFGGAGGREGEIKIYL